MAAAAKPVPEGFRTITPHLTVSKAAEAIAFYKKAFGAEEIRRMPGPEGKVMHAELRIGDSVFMINDEFPEQGALGPESIGGSPVTIHLYVADADALHARAVAAGATSTMAMEDMFWGDRFGAVQDPYGHKWSIAMHKEDLTIEEAMARAKNRMG